MNQEFSSAGPQVSPLVAPSSLTSAERLEFRRAALESLEAATRLGATVVEVDLGTTVEMDASGLGVLILLQKRAREHGMITRLVNVPNHVAATLISTQLEQLFDVVRAR